jgi:drug/metabolite transporter (DMT)-like permease
MSDRTSRSGVAYAVGAAALFGASTPFAKNLLPRVGPWLLAGLLYLGSGIGLMLYRLLRSRLEKVGGDEAQLSRADAPWLAAAILCGGVIGPLLLMVGLKATPASSASLLLNLEGVFTALLAWFVFKENFDVRIAWGMALISGGAVVLSWNGRPVIGVPWGAIAIAGACLAWAADNNLTRKVSASDPVQIAMLKGLCAGTVNTSLALLLGASLPAGGTLAAAGIIGLLGYGVSLTFFVLALRHLGSARTGAYFSIAPFVGAALSVALFGETFSMGIIVAAVLMGGGVWLHLTERHEHGHRHEAMEHEHRHTHDEHHQHSHALSDPPGEPHTHRHRHEPMMHSHPHYPDLHHRHPHR